MRIPVDYLRLELVRLRRDPVLLLIVVVLPVFFYLGVALVAPVDAAVPGGGLRLDVMVGMACYGAATAASTLAGQAALERVHGWARQLALTPLTVSSYVATKALVAATAASAPVLLTFVIAAITGVRTSPLGWLLGALVCVLGSLMWGVYGLTVGLAFRSESALAASAAGLVLLAFLGGVFVPVPADLMGIARWTPMAGYVQLARSAASGVLDGVGWAVLNVLGWAGVLAALAGRFVVRARERR